MKIRIIVILMFLVMFLGNLFSNENETKLGIKVMAGGRYDDMRMCVGSDAGVKGGPIADVMLLIKRNIKPNVDLAFELPVMRPLLFGLAFEMLQFEPQISMEFNKQISNNSALILAPGVGISLHYGPDYKSDLDNRGKDFFAAGPIVSGLIGYSFDGKNDKSKTFGIRMFYTPLFSGESSSSPGQVFGAVIEAQFQL
jgi:hypothetical protein